MEHFSDFTCSVWICNFLSLAGLKAEKFKRKSHQKFQISNCFQ